ncbi:MAG: tripartite tricarboxylate transporter substrate binding protein [Burkholderiaceae bacterium]|jgi:tripartite-type tricarboxylate transporter receptor subunit TctC|nr:tripartite tricarboxylate transporter substrate binding protein [Burkholderiaceae bacterium]MEB2352939.1 tripartite tricarboxylate transporter substrate binding protein [Burkholderiaceae bacterium]
MTTVPRLSRRTLILAALAAAPVASPFAQAFPSGPITLIVPGPAGGTPDNVARRLAEQLRTPLGQVVVVENRAGASGIIGVRAVAAAAPDGHTLLMGFAQTMAINLVAFRKLPYDPVADFVPIARLVEFELGLAVPASLPVRTVAELIAWLKANPDRAAFGSFGSGSPSQFAGAMFSRMAGVKTVHVPYKGSAPLVTDLIGGQVHFGFVVPQIVDQHVQGGRLRLLAVTGERRSVNRPTVPTMKELGFDQVVAGGWYGLFAPRGTPAPVVDRLSKAVAAAMKSAELGKALALQDVHPAYQASREFGAFQQSEIARWRAVAARTGFMAEE